MLTCFHEKIFQQLVDKRPSLIMKKCDFIKEYPCVNTKLHKCILILITKRLEIVDKPFNQWYLINDLHFYASLQKIQTIMKCK